jgi:dihydrolipoamide dehydrogenase
MNYDVIIIGSGPGGYPAAIRASQLGLKTAIVEVESLGGICLNWGCIPTKALIKSAEVFDYIKHGADYGIQVNSATPNFEEVIKRSRSVAEQMSKGVNFLMKKNKIDILMGWGSLKKEGVVEVKSADGKLEQHSAKHIILATGGRSRELPNLKQDDKHIIGYRRAMTLGKQPKSMIVVGSGAIGVEFAYFYNTMGTKVTIVEFADNIIPLEDEDISKALARNFKKAGINLMTSSNVEAVEVVNDICHVKVKTATGYETLEAEIVLSAVGVTSNLENMGLEEAGIKTDKGKILVDDYYKTNISGVYAIGDIVRGPALAHVATAEAITCIEKIAGLAVEPINYGNIPGCTYCEPEIASVGMTEKAAKEAGYELKIGKFPFSASGRARASGEFEGFVKVIYDAKYGEWLGAHMIGHNVTELIAEVVTARKLETTAHEIMKSIHPHPTMSEAVKEATADAYGEAIDL